jgi:hypothetical protein
MFRGAVSQCSGSSGFHENSWNFFAHCATFGGTDYRATDGLGDVALSAIRTSVAMLYLPVALSVSLCAAKVTLAQTNQPEPAQKWQCPDAS